MLAVSHDDYRVVITYFSPDRRRFMPLLEPTTVDRKLLWIMAMASQHSQVRRVKLQFAQNRELIHRIYDPRADRMAWHNPRRRRQRHW